MDKKSTLGISHFWANSNQNRQSHFSIRLQYTGNGAAPADNLLPTYGALNIMLAIVEIEELF